MKIPIKKETSRLRVLFKEIVKAIIKLALFILALNLLYLYFEWRLVYINIHESLALNYALTTLFEIILLIMWIKKD